jgi:aerobic C4-dicarboxylate transport protein
VSAAVAVEGNRQCPGRRKDRTHYLYLAVIVAAIAGAVVGLAAPGIAVELKPIGTGFVNLIKMLISPIVFCTLVLGIGSVRQAAKVGKVGGLALAYFVAMSFVASPATPSPRCDRQLDERARPRPRPVGVRR